MNLYCITHSAFDQLCESRKADPAKVAEAITRREDDGTLWIDADHPTYPRRQGVGVELKKILAGFGIHATANCTCNRKAKVLDANGPQWCLDNIDRVVDWLGEEARKRRLPFFRTIGKMLVKRAVKNFLAQQDAASVSAG